METPPDRQRRAGILYSLAAYTCWGLFPLYFHLLGDVSPIEVVANRVVWSLVFLTENPACAKERSYRNPTSILRVLFRKFCSYDRFRYPCLNKGFSRLVLAEIS